MIHSETLLSVEEFASNIAKALVHISMRDGAARLSTPLIFPGGAFVGVEIARHRGGYLVSDMGSAMREAELMGAERQFARIAQDVARKYGVRFDHNMLFDIEVPQDEVMFAVIAVSNAAKSAVEATAMQAASREPINLEGMMYARLERIFPKGRVRREALIRGSSDDWRFDASVETDHGLTLFEFISPHANAVSSAVTKFLDVRDLGKLAPGRVAVLYKKSTTPYISVLARTATIIEHTDADAVYLQAA